jgi:hypothetical protein
LEFSFTIIHIAGSENVVADALSRIFTLRGSDPSTEQFDKTILPSFHNSIIGHHGFKRTQQLLQSAGITWSDMSHDIKMFLKTCLICQKVKPSPAAEISSTYHLVGNYPMESVSVDTIGPLPMDSFGNKYILVIIDNFTKYSMLYPTATTTAVSFVQALINHIGIFGFIKFLRTDGGSQFTADVCQELSSYLKFSHLIVLPYHHSGNGLVERRNREINKHLRAMVLSDRISSEWSTYLPLVQRIANSHFDSSIGTTPTQLLFGDMLANSSSYIFPVSNHNTPVSSYLQRLSQAQSELISLSDSYI